MANWGQDLGVCHSPLTSDNELRKTRRTFSLDQLQQGFQQRQLQEKERKLSEIYDNHTRRAMEKTLGSPYQGIMRRANSTNSLSKGYVRQFFLERREMEQRGVGPIPPIDWHFKMNKHKVKNVNAESLPSSSRTTPEVLPPIHTHAPSNSIARPQLHGGLISPDSVSIARTLQSAVAGPASGMNLPSNFTQPREMRRQRQRQYQQGGR